MTPIEQAARKCFDEMELYQNSQNKLAILAKHFAIYSNNLVTRLATIKPLEDEVEKLQEQVKDLAYNLAHTEMELSATKDENKRLQKSLEGSDELNLTNQQLADENKRLREALEAVVKADLFCNDGSTSIEFDKAITKAEQALTKPT